MSPSRKKHSSASPTAAAVSREIDSIGAFPIVGIGASAGGLDAFRRLLAELPPDTGMAFVLVQHLSPDHVSHLSEILSRSTAMPVIEVHDEPEVKPNHVYVIPPNRDMVIGKRSLQLLPRGESAGLRRPIDTFLQSLAEDQSHCAIGVVLSGTGNDGSVGIEEIKAQGGITFAQDDSAQFDGMPLSAVGSGCVDFVLAPEKIATELARIGRHPYVIATIDAVPPEEEDVATRILRLLRERTRVDFSHYKATTLYRRMSRRMLLHSLDGLSSYLDFLRKQPEEVHNLYRDILINVTCFFRDPKAFDALRDSAFPALLKGRAADDPIRIWVLGCSTGEEAYSLAIALSEYMRQHEMHAPVNVFATDLNEQGVERARTGIYPADIATHVGEERLQRYFSKVQKGYRIVPSIREMCVFARQNVLADPPFSRMDLISCRNLLIYMEPVLQRRILPLFHYALKPGGFLLLGSAESVGPFTDLFDTSDARHRLYTKIGGASATPDVAGARFEWSGTAIKAPPVLPRDDRNTNDILREADRIALTQYGPPAVLVNQAMDVLHFRGDTSAFLAMSSGRPSVNLLKLAREGLLVGLRTALQTSIAGNSPNRQEGLQVKVDDRTRTINLQVLPVPGGAGGERCFLVVFEDAGNTAAPALPRKSVAAVAADAGEAQSTIERLTGELAATREYLQTLVEDREASAEEMQSASEEIQSSNEELQSVNEELQTSKEEIQAANEELTTINEEMRGRNDELLVANADLINFLASTQMALVMLGPNLRIRRFTPEAESILNLIPADAGRLITDLKFPIDLPDLDQRLRKVIETGEFQEEEVKSRDGRWYSLRLRPYRGEANAIDGALIVLIDIAHQKRMQLDVHRAEERSRLLMEGAIGIAIILLDVDGLVNGWSIGAERLFGYSEAEILGQHLRMFFTADDVLAGRPDRELAMSAEIGGMGDDNWLVRKGGEKFWAGGAMTALRDEDGTLRGFSKVVRDMSERRTAEEQLQGVARRKDVFLATLAHELRNPLAPLRNALAIIAHSEDDPVRAREAHHVAERQLKQMVHLVDDLLDVARIAEGKIRLRHEPVDLGETIRVAVEIVRPVIDGPEHLLDVTLPNPPIQLFADANRLSQVFANLLNNAAKFTPHGGTIAIAATRVGNTAIVSVRDSGIGLDPAARASIFEMFTQIDRPPGRAQEGLGVGLSLVRTLVDLHGGTVEVASEGKGKGCEFIVRLPIGARAERMAGAMDQPKPVRIKRRVLLVDDNKDAVETMGILLELLGYVIRAAHTARECLESIDAFKPDVVLLDIGLPDQNGYEVCRRIRELAGGRDVVLIAVTGWGREEDKRKAIEAGFDGHLTKPVDLVVLERMFERA